MDEISAASQTSAIKPNLLDYLFFLRPMLHPPVWTIVILGYFYRIKLGAPISRLILLLAVSSAAAGWAYAINQISDIESDRFNNKLYFLPYGIISVKSAYIIAGIMLCVTLIGGFLIGPIIGMLFIAGLILGYIYSGKPFYAKNNPLGGTLANGIAHGILPFLAGYIAWGGRPWNGVVLSLPYFFAIAAVYIGTTIPDIGGDSRSGKITPGVALGPRPAMVTMTISLIVSFILALINHDLLLTIVAGISLPFYVITVLKSNNRIAIFSIKLSILLLSLAACLRFWPYAIVLVILFAGVRFYYRKRFGSPYPSIT